MGRKKKRAAPDERERIFCYYCERNFQNEQVLLSHQREKHLKCPTCSKRMISVSGLSIHSMQVHNVPVNSVPNAIEGRTSISVDVVGMTGIPSSYYANEQRPANKTPRSIQNQPPAPVYDAPPPPTPHYPSHYQYSHAQYQMQQPYATTAQMHPYQSYYQNDRYAPQYSTHMPQDYYRQQTYPPQNAYTPYQDAATAHHRVPTLPQHYPRRDRPHTEPKRDFHSNGNAPNPTTPDGASVQRDATPATTSPTPVTQHPSDTANAAPATQPSSTVRMTRPPEQIKIVFDRVDVSMEELRANLPRYRLQPSAN